MAVGDYTELVGRKTIKTKTHYFFHTRGCASAINSTGVPKVTDALAVGSPGPADTATVANACVSVQFDEVSEPGRVMVYAVYRRPIGRAESAL